MILTTHRLLYSEGGACCEIPLSFVAGVSTGGGMFYSHRVEVNLDQNALSSRQVPFYFVEYTTKILKQEKPAFKWNYPSATFHFKKFENATARDQMKTLLEEAKNKRVWMQPLVSE